jgi:tripartite-type tricarboxylate transporter receptor subunit TctC
MVADPVTGVPQVRGGSIKAYAVTAKSRLSTAPEIPTVDEAGLPGYHVSLWHGFWMPKGTPQPIMAKLNAAMVEALADPTCRPSSPRSDRTSSHPTAEPAGARRASEGRNREMVAADQGGRDQGRVGPGAGGVGADRSSGVKPAARKSLIIRVDFDRA